MGAALQLQEGDLSAAEPSLLQPGGSKHHGTVTAAQLLLPAASPERVTCVPDVVSPIIDSTRRVQAAISSEKKTADEKALQALNELLVGRTFLQGALERAPELWDLWREYVYASLAKLGLPQLVLL
jgi:hypothetical protein